jgi:hypothetical protein
MNSTAAIKAFTGRHGGTVCTSSNASKLFTWAFARGPQPTANGRYQHPFEYQTLLNCAQLAAYVLSLGKKSGPSLPAKGEYTPPAPAGNAPAQGAVVLRASYTDQGANGLPGASADLTAGDAGQPRCQESQDQHRKAPEFREGRFECGLHDQVRPSQLIGDNGGEILSFRDLASGGR